MFSPSYVVGVAVPPVPQRSGCRGSPGASGLVRTASSLIRQARASAKRRLSSSRVGTSSNLGSPTQRPRSANAILLASMRRCRYRVSLAFERSVDSRMLSASPTLVPPEEEGAMP